LEFVRPTGGGGGGGCCDSDHGHSHGASASASASASATPTQSTPARSTGPPAAVVFSTDSTLPTANIERTSASATVPMDMFNMMPNDHGHAHTHGGGSAGAASLSAPPAAPSNRSGLAAASAQYWSHLSAQIVSQASNKQRGLLVKDDDDQDSQASMFDRQTYVITSDLSGAR
jgi:hypothetical protein